MLPSRLQRVAPANLDLKHALLFRLNVSEHSERFLVDRRRANIGRIVIEPSRGFRQLRTWLRCWLRYQSFPRSPITGREPDARPDLGGGSHCEARIVKVMKDYDGSFYVWVL